MNLLEEIRLGEAKKDKDDEDFDPAEWLKKVQGWTPEQRARAFKNFGDPPDPETSPDASYRERARRQAEQERGPTPGGEGGSDTTRSEQPVARPHSTKGSVRRVVKGTAPHMPAPGEKFETEEQGEAAKDFLKGKKKKQQEFKFESRLLEALLSNEEMLLEFTSKNWKRRGHTQKMSGAKKALIGGALAAALAAGVAGSKGKKSGGPKRTQQTHQTQGHGVSSQESDIGGQRYDPLKPGPSGQVGEDPRKPKSMGRGRVTQDKDL